MPASAADLVRLAFDYALEKVVARATRTIPAYVTRKDLEQAIIELRFSDMAISTLQLDLMRAQHEANMRAMRARHAAEQLAGDVPDATIIEPTGDEPTHRPFGHAYLGAPRHIGCVFCGRPRADHA